MASKKDKKEIPAEILELYTKLVATVPEIKRKGANIPYTSHNGHMFSFLADDVLSIRLPEQERISFIKKYKTHLKEAYGIVMKEYVVVPPGLLAKTKELTPYLEMSLEYIKTLKPKPTKK